MSQTRQMFSPLCCCFILHNSDSTSGQLMKAFTFCHCKHLVSGRSFLGEKPLPHRELGVLFEISRREMG